MGKRQDDGKDRIFLKPSPNEEFKLLQDEKQKLRKLRLQQVRQQEKALANQVRKKFKEKEKQELNLLGNELKRKWEYNITEKRTALQNLYLENVSHVGEGHHAALMRDDDGAPKLLSLEDETKVAERYKEAVKKLKADEAERAQLQCEKTEAKQKALEIERIRAARVAALEPPVPDIAQSLELIQKRRHIKQKNIDQYSSTYYHLPSELVERAAPNDYQIDARDAAKEEEERIQNAKEDADRNFTEQMEKARLRHKHARSKLLLQKDHDKLLEELEHFERIDRQRRQDIVSKIPKHVFEPPHRRMEANEERQREIEHAFEDMYMAQTNYMGDVTAVQEPLVTSPAMTDDALDTTTEKEDETGFPSKSKNVESDEVKDDVISMAEEEGLKEQAELTGHGKKKVLEEAEKIRSEVKPSSKDPLRRLLKKIDLQRDRWRSKTKTVKETEEHDYEVAISDEGSGFSEGTLTISTVNTQSVESDVLAKPKETLLHPYEEAERTRVAAKKSEVRGADVADVEKQKQLLQQQKLKLQLQQQQVLQEHLQLQFDMLQNEIETTVKDNENDAESSATKPRDSREEGGEDMKDLVADKDTRLSSALDSLSSGLLSEDEKTISVSDSLDNEENNGSGAKEDAMFSSPSITSDSRVIASLGRREVLSSIPESVYEDDFAALTPVHSRPDLDILSQPMPIHIEMPIGLQSGGKFSADKFETRIPSFQVAPPPTTIPVAAPQARFEEQAKTVGVEGGSVFPTSRLSSLYSHAEDAFPGVTLPLRPLQMPDSSTAVPFFNVPTSAASTFPSPGSQPSNTFQLPDNAGTDTASYLKFYQEQLADQQERIREQQRAIQTRQQQRLEELKQFQERLRMQRTDSAARLSEVHHGFKNVTDPSAHWRSLVPTSRDGHEGSSSGDDIQSDTEPRSNDLKRFSEVQPSIVEKKSVGHSVPKTLSETRISSDGDDTTSSSLNPYPSDIVPPHRFDDRKLFPNPSELGLWSDSSVHLSSSDATKSSSGATFEESRRQTNNGSKPSGTSMAYQAEVSSSSLSSNNKSSSDPNRSSESASVKSRKSIDSGPLSISSLPKSDKSLSSSASDSNNNLLLRMESSFQHFQKMIEEAKTLNENYLSPSKQLEESLKELSSLKTVADTEEPINDDMDDPKKSVTHHSSHKHQNENDVYEESLVDNDYFSPQENQDDEHNFDEIKTFEQNREELYRLLNDPNRSPESERIVENVLQRESEMERRDVRTEDEEGVVSSQRRPLINLDDENFIPAMEQYPVGRNLMENERRFFELPDVLGRALSIIPEETVDIDDDLSEGVIEDDDHDHFSELNMSEPEDFYTSSGTKDNTESFSFRETVYRSPNVSNNSFGISPSVSHSVPGIHRIEERQSFEISSDNSGNRYPPDSHRMENPLLSELVTTSETFDESELGLRTIAPTTANKSGDFPHSASDVVISGFSDLSLSHPDGTSTGTSGLSLQEAFQKNRSRFFKDSEQRVLRAKEARFRLSKPPVVEKSEQKTGEYSGGIDHETNRDKNSQVSPDLKSEDVVGAKPSDGRQKIGKQDRMARTKRLYDNLPDVRKKQEEKRREETYAGNRAKAHQFQQETRQRLRKLNAKKTGRKQS